MKTTYEELQLKQAANNSANTNRRFTDGKVVYKTVNGIIYTESFSYWLETKISLDMINFIAYKMIED